MSDNENRPVRVRRTHRVHLGPGDVVLLEVAPDASPEACTLMAEQWRRKFPEIEVCVLPGARFGGVLRTADSIRAHIEREKANH